jgi:hypothetical protein
MCFFRYSRNLGCINYKSIDRFQTDGMIQIVDKGNVRFPPVRSQGLLSG